MSRAFYLIAGLAVTVLVLLFVSESTGEVLGMEPDFFAGFSVTALWGAFIASGMFHRGISAGSAAFHLAIWAVILATLMAGYTFFGNLH